MPIVLREKDPAHVCPLHCDQHFEDPSGKSKLPAKHIVSEGRVPVLALPGLFARAVVWSKSEASHDSPIEYADSESVSESRSARVRIALPMPSRSASATFRSR